MAQKRKAPQASPAISQAELKSRIMTEIMRDMIANPAGQAAGYDRHPGGHDRYGKAGRSGAEAVINPADRLSGVASKTRGGRG
jgi:hypothetical protein